MSTTFSAASFIEASARCRTIGLVLSVKMSAPRLRSLDAGAFPVDSILRDFTNPLSLLSPKFPILQMFFVGYLAMAQCLRNAGILYYFLPSELKALAGNRLSMHWHYHSSALRPVLHYGGISSL